MPKQISFVPTMAGWQAMARRCLEEDLRPEDLFWVELGQDQPDLGLVDEIESEPSQESKKVHHPFKVPAAFLPLAAKAGCHRDPVRWTLLYRVLWRLTHGEKHLLEVSVDEDVHKLRAMEKSIGRDVHKMRAFVRFREVERDGIKWYVAWFEPEHHIVEWNAPFFIDRFAGMNWSILTPDRCAHWDGKALQFTEGVPRSESPDQDKMEDLWIRYYSSIFNPARVKTGAMQSEMPKRYWKNLPEAAVIPSLVREAPGRVKTMMARSQGKESQERELKEVSIPANPNLDILREAAACCQACPLYRNATQTVFGEGLPQSRIVLIGEQPGDQEDKQGHPFVGPAGQLLDRALAEAGINRDKVYVTNTVKHFKWEPRGKTRLHKKASAREIAVCKAWLDAEMQVIHPEIIVCLGATAATAVLGPGVRVLQDRGRWMKSFYSEKTLVTVHPSSLLRQPDEESKQRGFDQFVRDLRFASEELNKE